jgi:hypothetical protein
MKTDAFFVGTSNTIGLGLELEFSERYQSDDFLENKCRQIPARIDNDMVWDRYQQEDIDNHRKYRWSKLVCDFLGLTEYNISDSVEKLPLDFLYKSRQAVDLAFLLNNNIDNSDVKKVLDKTKVIFFEFGYIRWWDANLHGVDSGFKWPSTPSEIENFINDKNIDFSKKQKAIDWLNEVNPIKLWEEALNQIKIFKENRPDIQIIILLWGGSDDVFKLDTTQSLIDNFLQMPDNTFEIFRFLSKHRLRIYDRTKAYNPKYKDKWVYLDQHATSGGHEIIAQQIINKIENNVQGNQKKKYL